MHIIPTWIASITPDGSPQKNDNTIESSEQSGLPSCLENAEETGIRHYAGTTEGAFARRSHNEIRAIATHRQMAAKPRISCVY